VCGKKSIGKKKTTSHECHKLYRVFYLRFCIQKIPTPLKNMIMNILIFNLRGLRKNK
jgi:hypothetical protein